MTDYSNLSLNQGLTVFRYKNRVNNTCCWQFYGIRESFYAVKSFLTVLNSTRDFPKTFFRPSSVRLPEIDFSTPNNIFVIPVTPICQPCLSGSEPPTTCVGVEYSQTRATYKLQDASLGTSSICLGEATIRKTLQTNRWYIYIFTGQLQKKRDGNKVYYSDLEIQHFLV